MRHALAGLVMMAAVATPILCASANPAYWRGEWPNTDFSKHSVPYDEIFSGGPPKDGIPSIDAPKFVAVGEAGELSDNEPVVGFGIGGDMRAYPLRILIWHEIVNDVVGEVPVAVTFCPLCNAALVFDRRVGGRMLEFGTTGKLRHSDLVMYDRQSESWWQQFTGEAIVGERTGEELEMVPSRIVSFGDFRAEAPEGKVQVPSSDGLRPYGRNPYVGYDSATDPFLYRGRTPDGIAPLARVVSVDGRAWSLALLRQKRRIETEDGLVITWEPGQNSALDDEAITAGADVGNVVVQRRTAAGLQDVAYGVDFAFAFHAFNPEAVIEAE